LIEWILTLEFLAWIGPEAIVWFCIGAATMMVMSDRHNPEGNRGNETFAEYGRRKGLDK
jgi:hypothetical protein